jgi:hypothetical protein
MIKLYNLTINLSLCIILLYFMTNVETEPVQRVETPLFTNDFREELKRLLKIKDHQELKQFDPTRLGEQIDNIWHEIFTTAELAEIGKLTAGGSRSRTMLPNARGSLELTERELGSGKTTICATKYGGDDWREVTDFSFNASTPFGLEKVSNHFVRRSQGYERFEIELARNGDISKVSLEERLGTFIHSEQIDFNLE